MNPQTDNDDMREMYVYHENLALGLAAALLRHNGHDVSIIDLRADRKNEREASREITESEFGLIGVSVNYATLPSALKLAQLVKMSGPATIVFGGEHATYLDEKLLGEYRCVDFVIRGEGEDGLVDLAGAIESGDDPYALRGVSYFAEDQQRVVRNPNRTPMPSLDVLPFAARDVAQRCRDRGVPIEIGILGQRGCPFPCSFCNANRFLGNDTMSLRYRSPKNLVDEMESLLPFFAERNLLLRFYDATFVTRSLNSRSWILGLCAELEERQLRIPFDVFVRADSFDFDNPGDLALIRRLRGVGMVSTYLGLEAGDDETLDIYNKKVHTNASLRAFTELRKLGVWGSTNGVITFHQQVTLPQIRNTLRFLRQVGLCTVWNLTSRVETLPGIRLGDEMSVKPRRSVWDVANYDLDDPAATTLLRILTDLNTNYLLPRFEDHLTRRLRDLVRIKCFYDGPAAWATTEAQLEAGISRIQQQTYAFMDGLLTRLDADPRWAGPAHGELLSFVDGQMRALGALQATFLTTLAPNGTLEPVLA
ncbi:radical SAM protein [Solwaraspora sp. WMMD406]|uniref:B12-binding domain-containing radical SAM protein n=1 Tax=Solwaraspora sp. WMMD406 TaxID=3016095 RepID=UPI0024160DFF|nr:radical SAM protein [Solwaraspora sp. WMMD406]MDG4762679.1 radical SAM protein [Solwaraspora sp. WMMD406]